jgi:hypothetical protein
MKYLNFLTGTQRLTENRPIDNNESQVLEIKVRRKYEDIFNNKKTTNDYRSNIEENIRNLIIKNGDINVTYGSLHYLMVCTKKQLTDLVSLTNRPMFLFDYKKVDSFGQNALFWQVAFGDSETFEYLYSSFPFDLECPNNKGENLLKYFNIVLKLYSKSTESPHRPMVNTLYKMFSVVVNHFDYSKQENLLSLADIMENTSIDDYCNLGIKLTNTLLDNIFYFFIKNIEQRYYSNSVSQQMKNLSKWFKYFNVKTDSDYYRRENPRDNSRDTQRDTTFYLFVFSLFNRDLIDQLFKYGLGSESEYLEEIKMLYNLTVLKNPSVIVTPKYFEFISLGDIATKKSMYSFLGAVLIDPIDSIKKENLPGYLKVSKDTINKIFYQTADNMANVDLIHLLVKSNSFDKYKGYSLMIKFDNRLDIVPNLDFKYMLNNVNLFKSVCNRYPDYCINQLTEIYGKDCGWVHYLKNTIKSYYLSDENILYMYKQNVFDPVILFYYYLEHEDALLHHKRHQNTSYFKEFLKLYSQKRGPILINKLNKNNFIKERDVTNLLMIIAINSKYVEWNNFDEYIGIFLDNGYNTHELFSIEEQSVLISLMKLQYKKYKNFVRILCNYHTFDDFEKCNFTGTNNSYFTKDKNLIKYNMYVLRKNFNVCDDIMNIIESYITKSSQDIEINIGTLFD